MVRTEDRCEGDGEPRCGGAGRADGDSLPRDQQLMCVNPKPHVRLSGSGCVGKVPELVSVLSRGVEL